MLCVVGKKAGGKKKLKEALSDIVTCSDEVFVLLTLENNYDRWMAECKWLVGNKNKEPTERDEKTFPVSKYTNSGKSQCNGRSRPLSGWARKGYLKFNEPYMLVRQDRQQCSRFELELLTQLQQLAPPRNSGHTNTVNEEEIFPANDWDGLEAPSNQLGSALAYNNYDNDNKDNGEDEVDYDNNDNDDDQYDHNLE
jgi:hypothetical protein